MLRSECCISSAKCQRNQLVRLKFTLNSVLVSFFLLLICHCGTGGHLNPAVTFSLCLLGRDRWRKFPMYFLFQTIGAFFGAAVIFGMYYGKSRL